MSQPRDALDLRRASEGVLLDALEVGHPLALAEAYHRTVPAAHAVARRLLTSTDDIEELLLTAYAQLWEAPPTAGPLEGWMRRTVWTLGVDRLRSAGAAPASPSLAGLVPDLPAPEVRFLDAAERAIAELADEERRALLLAHDKGVPTSAQDEGAAEALARALSALAGPEASAADRQAIQEDGCRDLSAIGDWCLGLATSREETEVDEAIEARPGCAAVSRAIRRGRRRIEGLPATPDMGQRILVAVVTTGGRPVAAQQDDRPDEDASWAAPSPTGDAPADMPAPVVGVTEAADEVDPFASLDETGPLPSLDDAPQDDVEQDEGRLAEQGLAAEGPDAGDPTDEADPFAPTASADPFAPTDEDPFVDLDDADEDPFADLDDADDSAVTATDDLGIVTDTTEPATAAAGTDSSQDQSDWRPDPGSTAELRLSDILAEGDDDDPFADLDDADDDPGSGDPYRALRGLESEPAAMTPDRDPTLVVPADGDDDLVGGYVEGQEAPEPVAAGGPSRTAAALAWILPILGGSAIGILIAITVFGPPS